jgi:hypothetical protein
MLLCECSFDLSAVVPISLERIALQSRRPESPNTKGIVQCIEGHNYPSGLILCQVCGTELPRFGAMIEGRAISKSPVAKPFPRLILLVGSKEYQLQVGDILGREGTVASEHFDFREISAWHVHITAMNGAWQITANPSATNDTYLDGHEIKRGIPFNLIGSHKLRLSSKCEVGLRVAPSLFLAK